MNIKFIPLLIIFFFVVFLTKMHGQEIGANFNHNPEIIDFYYLEKTGVHWVRTTPRILDYVNGTLKLADDEGLAKIVEAGEKGYDIAFGFRWDFKMHNMRIPKPGSKEEKRLFDTQRKIMEKVGPHVKIFKLGNEPNLETLSVDMHPDKKGKIPLVKFMIRQLEMVVEPYYASHSELAKPQIYIGSFPRLFDPEMQKLPAVVELIKLSHASDKIDGLSVHLHISKLSQIDESFEFVREIMPKKPIIVPEFSLHRLYLQKIDENISATKEGMAFATKYGRDPDLKIYEWCEIANTKGVSMEEWRDMFYSRSWFPKHYLNKYKEAYTKYGVVLATFPLLQQSCPEDMTKNSPMWFVNPVFCQKSLLKQPNGDFSPNPLVYDDFVEWASEK